MRPVLAPRARGSAETSRASALNRAREASERQRLAYQRFREQTGIRSSGSAMTIASERGERRSGVAARASRGDGDGNLFVESFFDLANVVSGGGAGETHTRLAERIGEDVYVQVNAWRLYTRDMKFHDGLAKVFSVKIASNGNKYDDALVEEVLTTVRVPLGGGKSDVPLVDLCPSTSVNALKNILRDYVDDRL
ncbi:Protein of unknown function DUF3181 [Ostreococcus tauri]|uniref:Uncharacterized protein n=1 Tax=Ostreococcus tauri TaxID=70448 RepID=Q01CQ4_OSTTA|nr:Protein of unknown function DUF3181 [Ostreococcus tauri]CAL52899.1 Protein of unknown function DUF3181 [Ostreococcus tauri]|eukprot:XP_003078159.1 Protein of unknown function DUF3181 [Ostreococcus tauri]